MKQREKYSSGVLGRVVDTLPGGFKPHTPVWPIVKRCPGLTPSRSYCKGSTCLLLEVGAHPLQLGTGW